MFDCVIIGAGSAGATAAYHLAKKGKSVLVLEKASLPRYKPCGGGVSPAITSWFDFDFSPVIDNTINKVEFTWKMGDPVQTELQMRKPMWMVKRDAFDQFIVEKAQKKGAEIKDNTEVTAIKFNSDHWQITTNNGNYNGRYLIAATGGGNSIADSLGFSKPQASIGAILEVKTTVPVEKQNTAYFEFGALKNGYIWNFPKTDGYSISAGIFRGNKGKGEELKKQLTEYASRLGINLSNSQYYEYPLYLWTEEQNLHNNNALLVGEAAGLVDPLTGEGIRPAIFSGLKAAEAIDQALAGDKNALANYTRIINQEWGADMALAQKLAGLFYQFPQIGYKVGVKRPSASQMIAKILCGELRYSDVFERAMKRLKKSLTLGFGG